MDESDINDRSTVSMSGGGASSGKELGGMAGALAKALASRQNAIRGSDDSDDDDEEEDDDDWED